MATSTVRSGERRRVVRVERLVVSAKMYYRLTLQCGHVKWEKVAKRVGRTGWCGECPSSYVV